MTDFIATGRVADIIHKNEEDGYCVLVFDCDHPDWSRIRAVGTMPDAQRGDELTVRGTIKNHSRFGLQVAVEGYVRELPKTIAGILNYLKMGGIRGVGPATAEKIVQAFGAQTIQVLSETPERLREIPGIGKNKMEKIAAGWKETHALRDIMIFLQSNGVAPSLAMRIYKQYGEDTIATVRTNPYRLARDVWGIGFLTADKIAKEMGVRTDAAERIEAGVLHVISQAEDEGHVCLPYGELKQNAEKALNVPPALIEAAVRGLAADGLIAQDVLYGENGESEGVVYRKVLHAMELSIAEDIRRLMNAANSKLKEKYPGALDTARRLAGESHLTGEQFQAVENALTRPLSVLTGGPGTGKTTTLKLLASVCQAENIAEVAFAAPTGRAAKRMTEVIGMEASTVHRLLGASGGGSFSYDREHPLPCDLIVLDETSMLDIYIAKAMLSAVENGAHVLLVGDPDQLPAVGAGDILRDILASERIPSVRLSQIFRQAQNSLIVTNAHRVRQGMMPITDNNAKDDFFFFKRDDTAEIVDQIVELVATRLPKSFGLDPVRDIQVLSPIKRAAAGVYELNDRLRAVLNPPAPGKAELRAGANVFRVGDKVMQTRNNYDLMVFNGSIGLVEKIDTEEQTLRVRFPDQLVLYEREQAEQLIHAYCISVHKGQGGEYPVCITVIHAKHYNMLRRKLFYTAITRAQKLCIIIGNKQGVIMAVKNDREVPRMTGLRQRLRGLLRPAEREDPDDAGTAAGA